MFIILMDLFVISAIKYRPANCALPWYSGLYICTLKCIVVVVHQKYIVIAIWLTCGVIFSFDVGLQD